jgi:hypothetical protein
LIRKILNSRFQTSNSRFQSVSAVENAKVEKSANKFVPT